MKVKELLRHKDIKTTMRYAHLAPADAREAAEALVSRSSHVEELEKKISMEDESNMLISKEDMAP